MRREVSAHENFFIAKIRDSESAQSADAGVRRVAMSFARRRAHCRRISKTPVVQALPAILTFAGSSFSGIKRSAPKRLRGIAVEHALRALPLSRQHFLKRDAVFSYVLVYSGCSAYRFPNARSDK